MTKRLLSMLLSLALLLSCVSGITLFATADDATTPIGYFDFGGARGAIQKSGGVVRPIMANNNEDTGDLRGVTTTIGTTGLYGYKITHDGRGIYFGGTLLNDVPDGVGVTYVVNYYIDSETALANNVMSVTDNVNGVKEFADLPVGELGQVFYSLSAEAVDAIQAQGEGESQGDTRLRVKALGEGAGKLYITGVTILSSLYCTGESADADMVEALHAHWLADEVNTKLMNAKEGNAFEAGYTGDTVCAACEAVLDEGEEIPATSDLPVPYAYMETASGTKQSNVCTGWGEEAWSAIPVEQIPDTDEYGVKLTGDWQGFFIGGNLFADIPTEQSVTMVVEYYITGDMSGRQQLFRYKVSDNAHVDLYTDTDKLVGGKSALIYHTFTEAERTAIGTGDMRFRILGCEAGAGRVYIQSVRLVNTEYVHEATDGGYAVWDANEQVVCDYYPDITATVSQNMSYSVQDEGANWNFKLSGDVLSADTAVNKPVYIKVKMKDTFTGAAFEINQFERYGGEDIPRWAYDNKAWYDSVGNQYRSFTLTDGEVAFILPETCFTNANNGGSLRLGASIASQIERIEIYDLNTFCENEKASAEDIEAIHKVLAANNLNVEKTDRVEATEEQPGYTGDTVCAICGDVLAAGKEIPVIDPNRPFATLETAGGNLVVNGATLSIKDNGNTDVVAIGDTGEYGILLTGDWNGFNMDGISLLGNTGEVAMLIEYYIVGEKAEESQMFRYQINDRAHVDLFTKANGLAHDESGLVYHIFTEDELAAIGDNDFTFRIMGCAAGANVTYIQSAKLVSADLLDLATDAGYAYIEFTEKPLTDLYPDITVVPSYNLTYADLEQHADHPDRDWLYRYIKVAGDLLAVNNQSRPVYITLYAAEGYENEAIAINAIERTAGAFGAGATVQMVDGVGSVFIPAATFTNKMNDGALRFWYEEVPKLARIEIMDAATYCGREDADAALVEMFHDEMAANLVNVNRLNKKDPTEEEEGYTGDVYCATCNTLLANGIELPKLEVSDLPDPYAYFDTANGNLKVEGMTLANQGASPVASPIGGSGEYGIKLTGDWQGFRMEGVQLPTDTEVALIIEYYVDAELTNTTQLFRYQTHANMPGEILPDGTDIHWDDIFNDQDNIKNRESGLLIYILTEEEVAAINAGDSVKILGCGPGANISYIQSVRFIDSWYVNVGGDLGFDYMSFEEVPLCEYYPTITGLQGSGMVLSPREEGTNPDNGEAVRYAYFTVTQALAGENAAYRPAQLVFMLKEDCGIESFQLDYQIARRDENNPGIEWGHYTVTLEEGVDGVLMGEVLLEDACFANELNGLGSIRLPNHPSVPVLDNLVMIMAMGLTDTSELQALVDGVDEAVVGKTKASADEYRAVVEEYALLLEDPFVLEEDVAAAVAAINEAAAALVDCEHGGDTKLVGAVEVTNHVVPGYTGDTHCAECDLLLEEGDVIPAHETEIRNIKQPTCKEPGNAGDRWCIECDELVAVGDSIMQLPHKWDEGVVTKPATPDTKGEITITCTVCGETKITRVDFEAGIGDVDNNGKVDSTDARLVLQYAVKKITPSALNLDVADVDGSGKVDSTDARLILQYAVKKINKFPAE